MALPSSPRAGSRRTDIAASTSAQLRCMSSCIRSPRRGSVHPAHFVGGREVIGLAHRVLVMRGGRVVDEFDGRVAREDEVMRAAFGNDRPGRPE